MIVHKPKEKPNKLVVVKLGTREVVRITSRPALDDDGCGREGCKAARKTYFYYKLMDKHYCNKWCMIADRLAYLAS